MNKYFIGQMSLSSKTDTVGVTGVTTLCSIVQRQLEGDLTPKLSLSLYVHL